MSARGQNETPSLSPSCRLYLAPDIELNHPAITSFGTNRQPAAQLRDQTNPLRSRGLTPPFPPFEILQIRRLNVAIPQPKVATLEYLLDYDRNHKYEDSGDIPNCIERMFSPAF